MRAILINSKDQTIKEVEVRPRGWLDQVYKLLGCDLIDAVRIDDHDSIYVDDEGLLKEQKYFFVYEGYPQPLAGNGLICGVDENGESVSANISLEEVRNKVSFVDWFGDGQMIEPRIEVIPI